MVGRQSRHRRCEGGRSRQRAPARVAVDGRAHSVAVGSEERHPVDDGGGPPISGDMQARAGIAFGRPAGPIAGGETVERGFSLRCIVDRGDDEERRGARRIGRRTDRQSDLAADPRPQVPAVVHAHLAQEPLGDLVDLRLEGGLVAEARDVAEECAEIHLLPG